ncbi:DUF6192 family protein [Streptomyces aculeolatus]|uniref:DUF6192 family protein n=1 Tax=Streptomyces aculeolatus TaxID=270689 RepID=UPI001CEDAE58|nr:DUF6192 family protein [Streptomyces aculeolatus]
MPGHSVRRGSEKARAVKDLTRDDEVAAPAAASLLSRPQTASVLPAAERVRAVQHLTCNEEVHRRVPALVVCVDRVCQPDRAKTRWR